MERLPLITKRLDNGCIVTAGNQKMNHDGYWRAMFKHRPSGYAKALMVHREVWKALYGPIPEGYEIDHLCKNRGCVNPSHLRCIDGSEHASHGNRSRYADRVKEIKLRKALGHRPQDIAQDLSISVRSVYNH